jgi:hypothetical protein
MMCCNVAYWVGIYALHVLVGVGAHNLKYFKMHHLDQSYIDQFLLKKIWVLFST